MSVSRWLAASALCSVLGTAGSAAAYRPFDGTDAGVAPTGAFELELGPAHYYRRGTDNYLIAPAGVLNLGFAPRFELVADFRDVIAQRHAGDSSRASLQNTDVLVKWVAHEGVLQGSDGPSLAFEGGVLTPELGGVNGFGAQLDGILSLRLQPLTLHFNEQAALTRDQRVDLFSGLILEAPEAWPVRPVAEVFAERVGYGSLTRSALLGGIWAATSAFDVDGAVRAARENGLSAFEVRFGFTWQIELWRPRDGE